MHIDIPLQLPVMIPLSLSLSLSRSLLSLSPSLSYSQSVAERWISVYMSEGCIVYRDSNLTGVGALAWPYGRC